MSDLEALLWKGDVQAAAALVSKRLAQNPADTEALLAGSRLAMFSQNFGQAADLINKAEAAGSREAPVWRAILAESTGDPQAMAMLEQVCATATRHEPFFVLGRALNAAGQFARALPRLEKALSLAPEHALIHFQLAHALMELGQVPKGMQHLEKTLRLNPLYTPAYIVMARMLAGNGQPADARKLLEQGVRILPNDPDLKRELASLSAA
jgi:protein O-GlcNAc transferase